MAYEAGLALLAQRIAHVAHFAAPVERQAAQQLVDSDEPAGVLAVSSLQSHCVAPERSSSHPVT